MNRTEAARILSERLVKWIARNASPRIGSVDEAWETVGPVDAEYMIALTEWVRTGSDEARLRLEDAYRDVCAAWMAVSECWTTQAD